MLPISVSASSSAASKGGNFGGGAGGFTEGDWNVATGAGGTTGLSTKQMMLIVAGLGVLWLLTTKRKK